MPGHARQASARMVQAAAGAIPAPSCIAILAMTIADAAGSVNWTAVTGLSFRVLDFWYVKTGGAGGANDTAQLRTAGDVGISNAVSINVADQAVVRATSIDDATHEIAGAGLRVNIADGNAGATDLSGIAYVMIALIA